MLFMGIDTGTQGVRALAVDDKGSVLASESRSYNEINKSAQPGHFEQNPEDWYAAVSYCVKSCTAQLKKQGIAGESIAALCIDGTSGSILPVDGGGRPLTNAVMYNDTRAGEEARHIRAYAAEHERKLGYKFNASFALPKILWIKRNLPEVYGNAAFFLHQTDYIVARLTGRPGVTDYSNALKTGYDQLDERWPEFIESAGLDREKLPEVAAPGKKIGNVTRHAAEELGLSEKTAVTAGATDGYTSALAAGAVKVGDWASIIGTTLVLKGITARLIPDPNGVAYSHKMPSGDYMLGGASNIGGKCLNARFAPEEFPQYNRFVDALAPTGVLIYPLTGKGERFPFLDPEAEEFIIGGVSDKKVLYAALMEGVGYAERFAFDCMSDIGAAVGDIIYTSGGACRSDEWLRIRASILNKQLRVPKMIDAAMGSALLAASDHYGSLAEAAANMIGFSKIVDPVKEKTKRYGELYEGFVRECRKHFKIGSRA